MLTPKYFSLPELLNSVTARINGIPNYPTWQQVQNLNDLAINVLDPLREAFGHAITVTSGYRCQVLNEMVSGSPNSHHLEGMAADIIPSSPINDSDHVKALYTIAKSTALNLPFCQCILEHRKKSGQWWVHISYIPTEHDHPRRHSFIKEV